MPIVLPTKSLNTLHMATILQAAAVLSMLLLPFLYAYIHMSYRIHVLVAVTDLG